MERGYRRIFSHPDYDRRLWLRTRSADPAGVAKATVASARGLMSVQRELHFSHTAGGDFHPALKTCMPRTQRVMNAMSAPKGGDCIFSETKRSTRCAKSAGEAALAAGECGGGKRVAARVCGAH